MPQLSPRGVEEKGVRPAGESMQPNMDLVFRIVGLLSTVITGLGGYLEGGRWLVVVFLVERAQTKTSPQKYYGVAGKSFCHCDSSRYVQYFSHLFVLCRKTVVEYALGHGHANRIEVE